MSKILEKVKKHVMNCPQYSFLDGKGKRSSERCEKFKQANDLMDGKLHEIHEWYIELKKILGIYKEK